MVAINGTTKMGDSPTITPIDNMGVPKKRKGVFSLDWLRFTVPTRGEAERFFMLLKIKATSDEPNATDGQICNERDEKNLISPLPYYDSAMQFQYGRLDWSLKNPSQKFMVTLTGKDLVNWLLSGGTYDEILIAAEKLIDVNFTRIDMACDIHDEHVEIKDIYTAMKDGTARTRIKAFSMVEGGGTKNNHGITVYIGSRESGRMIRVYDKAAQQKMEGDWTRIEIEVKSPFAEKMIQSSIDSGIAPTMRLAVRQMVRTGVDWFDERMNDSDVAYLEPVGRKATDWEKWIISDILPQIEKAIAQDIGNVREDIANMLSRAKLHNGHGNQ